MGKIKCIKDVKSFDKTYLNDYIYTDETAYEREFEGERYSDLTAEERIQYRILRKSMISFGYGDENVFNLKDESITDFTDDEMKYLQKWLDTHKLTEDDIDDYVHDVALEFGGYKKYFKKLIKLTKLDQEQATHIASVMAVYNENRGQIESGEDIGFNPENSDEHRSILLDNEILLVDSTLSNSVIFTIKPEVKPHQFDIGRLNSWIESNREKYKQMILGWLNEERVKLESINREAKYKLRFGHRSDFLHINYHLTPMIGLISGVRDKCPQLDIVNRKLLNRSEPTISDGGGNIKISFEKYPNFRYEKINSFILKDGSSENSHNASQLLYTMCLHFINDELESDITKVGWKRSEKILQDFSSRILQMFKKFVANFYYDTVLDYILDELDAKAIAQDLDYINHHNDYMDRVKFYPTNMRSSENMVERIQHLQGEFNSYYKTSIELDENEISHLISLHNRDEGDKCEKWFDDYTTAHWYFDIYEYLESKK